MSTQKNTLPKLLGWVNIGLGIVLFLGYWVYLPMPEKFASTSHPDPGMILYALATAGGAFVAWGMLLRGVTTDGISRTTLFKASAAGFGLLGLMRLGTALFPHPPFDHMLAVPIVECLVFCGLSIYLFKSA